MEALQEDTAYCKDTAMQTVIYVLAKPNQQSLREAIVADLGRFEYGLDEMSQQKKGRSKGWAKINCKSSYGCLNIEWDSNTKTLIGRAVSKGGNHPNELVGAFISYLLRWQGKRISSITLRTM
jgi:hypothetical protein